MGLHELPALERFYIGAAQIEPFPVLAFLIKSLVPIRLDTDGIIGTDDMHSNGLLGQLYRKFVFTTASRVAPANFVVAPRLDQIESSEASTSSSGTGAARPAVTAQSGTTSSYLSRPLQYASMRATNCCFDPNREKVLCQGKARSVARLQFHFAHGRKFPQLAHQGHETL